MGVRHTSESDMRIQEENDRNRGKIMTHYFFVEMKKPTISENYLALFQFLRLDFLSHVFRALNKTASLFEGKQQKYLTLLFLLKICLQHIKSGATETKFRTANSDVKKKGLQCFAVHLVC